MTRSAKPAPAALERLEMNPLALRGAVAVAMLIRYGVPLWALALVAAAAGGVGEDVASILLVVTLPLFTYAGVLSVAGAIATLCFKGSSQGLGISFRYWRAVLSVAFGRRHDRGITVVR